MKKMKILLSLNHFKLESNLKTRIFLSIKKRKHQCNSCRPRRENHQSNAEIWKETRIFFDVVRCSIVPLVPFVVRASWNRGPGLTFYSGGFILAHVQLFKVVFVVESRLFLSYLIDNFIRSFEENLNFLFSATVLKKLYFEVVEHG